jgi:hypothetical protein
MIRVIGIPGTALICIIGTEVLVETGDFPPAGITGVIIGALRCVLSAWPGIY